MELFLKNSKSNLIINLLKKLKDYILILAFKDINFIS